MSKQTENQKNTTNTNEVDADVLYQKLGDRWFAFSLIGDEMFMSEVPADQIDSIRGKVSARNQTSNEPV